MYISVRITVPDKRESVYQTDILIISTIILLLSMPSSTINLITGNQVRARKEQVLTLYLVRSSLESGALINFLLTFEGAEK